MNPDILIKNFISLSYIVQAAMVMIGICLSATGLFKLKRYGEMRSMMSQQMSIAGPLFHLFSGVILLVFPTFANLVLGMVWSNTNPLHYHGNGSIFSDYLKALILFIRLFGCVSIIRGVVMLSRFGGQQSQPGMLGKALIFIIGGGMALHILGTINLFRSIFNL